MLWVKGHKFRQKVVSEGLGRLMSGKIVLLFILDYFNEEIFEKVKFILIKLSKGIESFMRKKDRCWKMWVGLNNFLNGEICTNIFELKDGLISKPNLFLLIDQLLIVRLSLILLHSVQQSNTTIIILFLNQCQNNNFQMNQDSFVLYFF